MPKIYTDNKLMSGTISDANMVNYNNTTSGLEATTVRGAIDEIQDEIFNINSNITPTTLGGIVNGGEKIQHHLSAVKIGNVALITGYLDILSDVTKGNLILKVPKPFIVSRFFAENNAGGNPNILIIDTDGYVKNSVSDLKSGYWSINFMYVLA